jgi:hypothetical protein
MLVYLITRATGRIILITVGITVRRVMHKPLGELLGS